MAAEHDAPTALEMRPAAFDAAAARYDEAFTRHPLGRWLRAHVQSYFASTFRPGDDVLELGCGTGEDALWMARRGLYVVATDSSAAMLAMARAKAAQDPDGARIRFERYDLAARSGTPPEPFTGRERFAGVVSNFGALNCVPDRRPVAAALARRLAPGGRLVLVVMGPWCPWEWLWYGLRGRLRTALRRLRPGVIATLEGGATVRVWYPSPRRLRREFAPYFRSRTIAGIGVLLPPSFARPLVDRYPRLFARLAAIDRVAGRHAPGTWLNDHYLMVLERTSHPAPDA